MTEERKQELMGSATYEVGKCKPPVRTYFTTETAKIAAQKSINSPKRIAYLEKKRQEKNMKETFKKILQLPIKDGTPEEIKSFAGSKGVNITIEEAMALALAKKAMQGDVKAFEAYRDTAGEKPQDKIDINANIDAIKNMQNLADAIYGKQKKEDE